MLLHLADTDVQFQSESSQIRSSWRDIFGDALGASARARAAKILLQLELTDSLRVPPDGDILYRDPQQIVDVYRQGSGDLTLHFRQGALVHLPPDRRDSARGVVTPHMCDHGQLEDVSYTAIAPLLRRQNHYLLHAAAMSSSAGAVLLVGPTHSGKTTTGLALLLSGWQHLAGDVVLLAQSDSGIRAHPTPGLLSARPKSFQLLPGLRQFLPGSSSQEPIVQPRLLLLTPDRWGGPDKIVAICFPEVSPESKSILHPIPTAVAMAHLMEESVDRWDVERLPQHMAFLDRLCRQARTYRLALAPDMDNLPMLLGNIT